MSARVASVRNVTRGLDLGTEILIADSWWTRARGFLGRTEPDNGHGILLIPCSSIHMMGMGFPVDVAFLGPDLRVLSLHHDVQPGLRTRRHAGATSTLELKSGRLSQTGTVVGDLLEIHDPGRDLSMSPSATSFKGEHP